MMLPDPRLELGPDRYTSTASDTSFGRNAGRTPNTPLLTLLFSKHRGSQSRGVLPLDRSGWAGLCLLCQRTDY